MGKKEDRIAKELEDAEAPGRDKRFVSERRVNKRQAKGWTKVIVDGEPVTKKSGTGQISYLMVPKKA